MKKYEWLTDVIVSPDKPLQNWKKGRQKFPLYYEIYFEKRLSGSERDFPWQKNNSISSSDWIFHKIPTFSYQWC